MEQHERILCRLSIRDDSYVDSLLTDHAANLSASDLDGKTHALVQLAALVASDARRRPTSRRSTGRGATTHRTTRSSAC